MPTIVECLCTTPTHFTTETFLTSSSRRTSNKIVIGTVLVLDDKVREPISVQHLLCEWFLGFYTSIVHLPTSLVPTTYMISDFTQTDRYVVVPNLAYD